jgi:iron transport multicopper oxidase
MFDYIPDGLNPNVTGWLVYSQEEALPEPSFPQSFDPFDDFYLIPYDRMEMYDHVDYSFNLDFQMGVLDDGAN